MHGKTQKTFLRDNLESIAIAILLVLFMRQMVVEAFKIPTGSMAPTLVGIHREVRCPNCGTDFRVGHDKSGPKGEAECLNCGYSLLVAENMPAGGNRRKSIVFRRPPWLWHQGYDVVSRRAVTGMDAANRIERWGSRIFVNKFIYRFRLPRRWELAVFDYPYGKENYIKRVVGLPGETVLIKDGNIYIEDKIARKPARIQDHIWVPVFDSRLQPRRPLKADWDFGETAFRWKKSPQSGALRVDASDTNVPQYVRYARKVRDFYAYNAAGNRRGHAAGNEVNDVRIRTDVVVGSVEEAESFLTFRVAGGKHNFRAVLPAGAGAGEPAVLYDGEVVVEEGAAPEIRPGRRHEITVERYDKTVAVKVDGKEIIRHLYDSGGLERKYEQFIGAGAMGASADFERFRLCRDIYYLPERGASRKTGYELDENSYFVLGDNSPHSNDSREWPSHEVPSENLIGRAFMAFWPISDISFLPAGEANR